MADIYIELNGEPIGPFDPGQVRQLFNEGRITGDAPAWYKDGSDRRTVAQVLEHFYPAPPKPAAPATQPKPAPRRWRGCLLIGAIVVLLVPCCLGPVGHPRRAPQSAALQAAHAIGIAMFAYATDHSGAYPDGKTSTEVFQKLVDEQYVSDPALFYIRMTGKTAATTNKLAAENVCFDVTSGVTLDSSDDVPLVILTGYRVTYAPGANATPTPDVQAPFSGIVVYYKNNSARVITPSPDGTIPAFVPTTFVAGKITYRQLLP